MMRPFLPIATALLLAPAATAVAQQPIEQAGTIAHQAARTGFAERIGEFRRSSATRFDPSGRNVAASYNWEPPGGRVLVTVYVYPAPPAARAARRRHCRDQFDQAQAAVATQFGDAAIVEQGAAPAMAGARRELGHRSVLRFRTMFGTEVQDVRSEVRLYCYVGGDWLVKYRATWNASLDAAAAIEAFVRAGPWPGRARPEQVVMLPPPSALAP
jgi:hypothetical protein